MIVQVHTWQLVPNEVPLWVFAGNVSDVVREARWWTGLKDMAKPCEYAKHVTPLPQVLRSA
jgi:hypothetical protein